MRKAVLLVMVCAVMLPALAAVCRYEFSGYITQTPTSVVFPDIVLDQPFTGVFSYTPMPASPTGIYNQSASLAFTTGSFSFAHTEPTQIIVIDYPADPVYASKSDSFAFDASGTEAGYSYFRTGVYLQDSTRTALTSTAICEHLPVSAFSVAQLRFTGIADGRSFHYIGTIDHLSPIPEPATLVMLLAAVPFLRRK